MDSHFLQNLKDLAFLDYLKKNPLASSLILHFFVFALLFINLPSFLLKSPEPLEIKDIPIDIDLSQIKISELTNLPIKQKVTPVKDNKTETENPKQEPSYTAAKPNPPKEEEPEEIDEKIDLKDIKIDMEKKEEKIAENDSSEEKKEVKIPPKPKKKPKVKKPDDNKKKERVDKRTTETVKTPEPAPDNLSSLLASVSEIKEKVAQRPLDEKVEPTNSPAVEGASRSVEGVDFRDMSISDKDLIAIRLRECWNLDPGAKGIQNMIIEIRVFLNQDGSVNKADILDTGRYNNDGFFRSVAESARRAVFICSPYKSLAEHNSDKYDLWKTMLIRFNPMSGGIE